MNHLDNITRGTAIVVPKKRDERTLVGLYQSHTQSGRNLEIVCDPAVQIYHDEVSERLIVEAHWRKPRSRYPFVVSETDRVLVGDEVLRELVKMDIQDYIPFVRVMQDFWELRKSRSRHELGFVNFYAFIPEQDSKSDY